MHIHQDIPIATTAKANNLSFILQDFHSITKDRLDIINAIPTRKPPPRNAAMAVWVGFRHLTCMKTLNPFRNFFMESHLSLSRQ